MLPKASAYKKVVIEKLSVCTFFIEAYELLEIFNPILNGLFHVRLMNGGG